MPVPEWLPAAPSGEFVVEFKWLLRKACLALGAAALVCAACTFRNVEKENLRYDCHKLHDLRWSLMSALLQTVAHIPAIFAWSTIRA